MSPTTEHLVHLLDDLPGESETGVEVTVRGVFDARLTLGPRDGSAHEESAALAAAAFEPASDAPRLGAFVSRDEAYRRLRDLVGAGAGRMPEAETARIARGMLDAVTASASPRSAVWCARLASAPSDGLVVVGAASVLVIRMANRLDGTVRSTGVPG